ncbi:MAG: EthD family reductase [Anaerolineales bacterium]|nr:EthD family reductase [Anaerolineales bacterium]
MYKLVILIDHSKNEEALNDLWPKFLQQAEQMPGLLKETTSRIDKVLYGEYSCSMIHELYFDSVRTLQEAMSSPPGQAAGEILQKMTAGKMTLLLADHREDNLENIRKYKPKNFNYDE